MDWRKWALATAFCGILDILYAFAASSLFSGRGPSAVLRSVAAGPFGDTAAGWGLSGALLGALTHFAIVGVMVAVGLAVLTKPPLSYIAWWTIGTLYGIVLYLVMYGLVLPVRFGAPFPDPDKIHAAIWFAPHILCVGWPLSLIAQGRLFRTAQRSS